MIIDSIKNIEKYPIISDKVKEFLLSLNSETQTGHYEIDDRTFANIDEYDTKSFGRFEAHKKYIDIQMLLYGVEQLDCIPVDGLKISEEYNFEKDVMFFENPDKKPDSVLLEPFKFAFIFPHEAHRPQMNAGDTSCSVKKVVVKILL